MSKEQEQHKDGTKGLRAICLGDLPIPTPAETARGESRYRVPYSDGYSAGLEDALSGNFTDAELDRCRGEQLKWRWTNLHKLVLPPTPRKNRRPSSRRAGADDG